MRRLTDEEMRLRHVAHHFAETLDQMHDEVPPLSMWRPPPVYEVGHLDTDPRPEVERGDEGQTG